MSLRKGGFHALWEHLTRYRGSLHHLSRNPNDMVEGSILCGERLVWEIQYKNSRGRLLNVGQELCLATIFTKGCPIRSGLSQCFYETAPSARLLFLRKLVDSWSCNRFPCIIFSYSLRFFLLVMPSRRSTSSSSWRLLICRF